MIKWLVKTCQSKPMPLPRQEEVPMEMGGPGAIRIDNRMTEETARRQEEQNNDMKYLGHGWQGLAYDLGDKVLKYTYDSEEVDRAIRLQQEPLPCTIRVLNIKLVQNKEPFIWSILAEKARPLDREEANLVNVMSEDLAGWMQVRWRNQYENFPYLFAAFQDMVECLQKNNFSTFEVRADNIGWVGGRLVLFDLGTHPIERGEFEEEEDDYIPY